MKKKRKEPEPLTAVPLAPARDKLCPFCGGLVGQYGMVRCPQCGEVKCVQDCIPGGNGTACVDCEAGVPT